jgi:hypothetical protein
MVELLRVGPSRPIPSFVIEEMMRVPDIMRKCVVFVGADITGQFIPYGTGFITMVVRHGMTFQFLVTAHHVINDIPGDVFAMRLNRNAGTAVSISLEKSKIILHRTRGCDIAMICIPTYGHDVYDYRFLPLDRQTLTKERNELWDIGIGDEVVTIGLYTSHFGETKNIPVVRVGHLAMLPEEPVPGPFGDYIEAYLVELRSIAGLSGSPVFINVPSTTVKKGKFQYLGGMRLLPLGMMLGYHVVESKEDQVIVPRIQARVTVASGMDATNSIDQRNTGFGIVVPIERVFDIFEREDFIKAINQVAAEYNSRDNGFRRASGPEKSEKSG